MVLKATALYAALLGLVGLALLAHVGRIRGQVGISLGDGGDARLLEAYRRQMNFVENVPLALILIALVEINGANTIWLHVLGGSLLLARIVHPFGIDSATMATPARFVGALGTFLVILSTSVTLLWQVFVR